MSKISYSAVVLDEISHEKLVLFLGKQFPKESETWKVYCHHMTICMGPLLEDKKSWLGKTISLNVIGFGGDDKVCAVHVHDSNKLSTNRIPHVTMAVNINDGGKPVMSNNIGSWKPYTGSLVLTGKVEELS